MNSLEERSDQGQKPKAKKLILPIILGCGCLLVVLLCCGLFGGGLLALRTALTDNEPYRVALEAARADPRVMEGFGGSIEPGLLVKGSISESTENGVARGSADITIPIKGPAGAGRIIIKATKDGDRWTVLSLIVMKDESGSIWILTPSTSP